MTDDQRFAWLEKMAKQSRSGISFDWAPRVEGERSGWRYMHRFFIGEPSMSIRDAIDDAMREHT